MIKFRAVIEYDGTAYHGWQLQKDLPTIQGRVESALARILAAPTRVHGAGRTDAGVHARGQVAHFVASWTRPIRQLKDGCNALLPPDIIVKHLETVPESFHARHSALSKTYVYSIRNIEMRSPFQRYYSWNVPYPLDLPLMAEAAAHLMGSHDFAAFGAATDGTPSTVRQILHAGWGDIPSTGMLKFTIRGTGFLRYMVRSLVGTLVMVGSGKITPADFLAKLESRDRAQSGPTAPPHGLCLLCVDYGDDQSPSAVDSPGLVA